MKPINQPEVAATPEPSATAPESESTAVGLQTLAELEGWFDSELADLELQYRDFWTNESAWVSMGNRAGRR